MRLTIIDEVGLRTKDGKGLVRGLNIQQIEIPDEVLAEIKQKFELWLKEKQNEHRSS
jgi:pantothenate kinase